MTCLNERVVCVIFVLNSGFAFAGDFAFDSPGPMTVATSNAARGGRCAYSAARTVFAAL